jgi:hypothetical protein
MRHNKFSLPGVAASNRPMKLTVAFGARSLSATLDRLRKGRHGD